MAASTYPQIGSYQFLNRKGDDPLAPVTEVDDITRANVDGHAWTDQGKHSKKTTWITIVDDPAPDSLIDGYRAYRGTLQTVKCPDGKTISNVMVLDVQRVEVKKVIGPVGGISAGSWILTARWELQAS